MRDFTFYFCSAHVKWIHLKEASLNRKKPRFLNEKVDNWNYKLYLSAQTLSSIVMTVHVSRNVVWKIPNMMVNLITGSLLPYNVSVSTTKAALMLNLYSINIS